jgi:ABC-2 type transport system ATP-binding protein
VELNVIELTDLTKRYGDHTAVDALNLTIRRGEIFGLLGPNGAGKSTTILMMLGLTEPTSGEVKVCGLNSTRYPVEVKQRVGYLPEDVGFYDDYSGLENLLYTARLNRIPGQTARARALDLLARVGLQDAADKKAGKYSRGMRQRLGLADVLIKSPEVIILDEPTLGIDPRGMQELLDLILKLSREDGLTVLLCSHHLQQVQQVCDRVGLFVKGKLIAEGDIPALSRRLQGSEPYTIEAVIPATINTSLSQLQDELLRVEAVKHVSFMNGLLRLSCTKDASADIARVIVGSGTALFQLSKKEYGLDEIYNHYFRETDRA